MVSSDRKSKKWPWELVFTATGSRGRASLEQKCQACTFVVTKRSQDGTSVNDLYAMEELRKLCNECGEVGRKTISIALEM